MRIKTCLFFTASIWIGIVQISHALVITSPKAGDTFKEGETVKLVAELSPDSQDDKKILYVGFNVTNGIDNCPDKIATPPRYECSFTIPAGSPRTIKINATGTLVKGAIASPWVSIFVKLPTSISLKGLRSFTGNKLFFTELAETEQIYIKGTFSDGVERDLRLGLTGTTYVCNNENVATVNADGLATAVGPGTAKITVRNGDKKLVLDVVVKPK